MKCHRTILSLTVFMIHFPFPAWSHAGMTSLTNEQIVAEVKWAEKIVFDITGLRTKYWRPPYGDVDNRVREILRQLGYVTVIWTKEWDSNDWQIPDKTITNKEVFKNFKSVLSTVPKLKGGVITLEHDLFTQTVNVAGPLLDMGMKKGLQPMDIAQCVNDPNPYQNSLVQKPVVAKVPVVPVKKVGTEAQKPLEKPKAVEPVEDENVASEGTDEDVVSEATAKASSANQLAMTVTSLVLVAVSAFLSL